jgi:hypothetical protein
MGVLNEKRCNVLDIWFKNAFLDVFEKIHRGFLKMDILKMSKKKN